MRKIGLATLISGIVLSLLLWLVRRSDWYAGELARGMSDFAELANSAFWAALVLTGFGVLLLLLSLRPSQRYPENQAPMPLVRTWVCPACGGENSEADARCSVCGTPRAAQSAPVWHCPFCGADNPETETVCQSCEVPRDRTLQTWICEGCGHENFETETRCTACGRRRFLPAAVWSCSVCGAENPEGASACTLCGTKRQEPGWTCGYCGRVNRESRTACANCGRPKGFRGGSWLCPVCGNQNRIDREICAGCGQPRP